MARPVAAALLLLLGLAPPPRAAAEGLLPSEAPRSRGKDSDEGGGTEAAGLRRCTWRGAGQFRCAGHVREPYGSLPFAVPLGSVGAGSTFMVFTNFSVVLPDALAAAAVGPAAPAAAPRAELLADYGASGVELGANGSLACFTARRRQGREALVLSAVAAAPARLALDVEVVAGAAGNASAVGGGGGGRGWSHLLFSMELDEIATLERLAFTVAGAPSTLQAYVFKHDSRCVGGLVDQGGCATSQVLVECLDRANGEAWMEKEDSAPALSLSLSTKATLTLSAASQPPLSTGTWFALVVCGGGERKCTQHVTLERSSEHGVEGRLAWAALLMLTGPGVVLLVVEALSFGSRRLWQVAHQPVWTRNRKAECPRSMRRAASYTAPGDYATHLLMVAAAVPLDEEAPKKRWLDSVLAFWALTVERCRDMRKPTPFFAGLLALAAAALYTPTFQFVIMHWASMTQSGNRDICYYNESCYFPLFGLDLPFNNLLSHIAYFVCGVHLFFAIIRAEHQWRSTLPQGSTIELDLRVFHALALAVPLEGLGSLCYHICPAEETFQFDTAFMLPIAHLSMFALINMRREEETGIPPLLPALHKGVPQVVCPGAPLPASWPRPVDWLIQRQEEKRFRAVRAKTVTDGELLLPTRASPPGLCEAARSKADALAQGVTVPVMPVATKGVIPLKYFLMVVCPLWCFNFVGTWFDVGLAYSPGAYWLFMCSVCLWTLGLIGTLSRFFPQDDLPAVRLLQLLLSGVVVGTLLSPRLRAALGGTANVSLGLSIFAMAAVTVRHIVMHDLRLNSAPQNATHLCKYMAKYASSLLFIIFTNLALGFFLSGVIDVNRSPSASRRLNRGCVLAGAFDDHDTWHLLSALSLTLWIMALLDMKLRMFKRCVLLPPCAPRFPLQRNAFSTSFSRLEEVNARVVDLSPVQESPSSHNGRPRAL